MKRLLLGALAASFLALIGVQAAHYHKDGLDSRPDSCAVCDLAHQSLSQAPNAAPMAARAADFSRVVPISSRLSRDAVFAAACARAPPAAA